MAFIQRIINRFRRELVLNQNRQRIRSLRNSLRELPAAEKNNPVLFFNSSTRLSGLSQNAGFSLISSLALQAEGIPVIHLVCKRGLSHCVLGTNNVHLQTPPPCAECIRTSGMIFDPSDVHSLSFLKDAELDKTAFQDEFK